MPRFAIPLLLLGALAAAGQQPARPRPPIGLEVELQRSSPLSRITVVVYNDTDTEFRFPTGARGGAGSLDDRARRVVGGPPTVLPELTLTVPARQASVTLTPPAFAGPGFRAMRPFVAVVPPHGRLEYASFLVPSALATGATVFATMLVVPEAGPDGPSGARALVADKLILKEPAHRTAAFRILSDDDRPLVTDADLVAYHWRTHTLLLKPGVARRLEDSLRGELVSGCPFQVEAGGEVCYTGVFATGVSSIPQSCPVLVFGMPGRDRASDAELSITLGYPNASHYEGEDPRADLRVKAALSALHKLRGAD